MGLGIYYIEIDWAGDGSYLNANSDVSGDIIKMSTVRGRKYASMVYGRSKAGRLEITLRNTDANLYDRFNTSSPLEDLVVPKRQIRFGMRAPSATDTNIAWAQVTVGSTELFPSGGTIAVGGNLTLTPGLTIDRVTYTDVTSPADQHLTIYRGASETVDLGAFFDAGGGGETLSLYFVNADGRALEFPYALIDVRSAASIEYDLTGTDHVIEKDFIAGLSTNDKIWVVIDEADLWLNSNGLAVSYEWGGYLDKITKIQRRGGRAEVQIRALGILANLTQDLAETPMYTTISPGAALGHILDAAGIPASARGSIANGNRRIARWWTKRQSGIKSAREIEETEAGFIHEDERGRFAFDAEYYRLSQHVSAATFSDEPTTGAILISSSKPEDPAQDIANIIRVPVRQYTVANTAVLWTLSETVRLRPGDEIIYAVEYPTDDSPASHIAVDAWTAMTATVDYTANARPDGLGTDLTASLGVTVEDRAICRMITVKNNHATVDLIITKLQARGEALVAKQPFNVEVQDQTSIDTFGKQDYQTPGQFIANSLDATEYGLFILNLQKDPLRRAAIVANMNDNLELAVTLSLSDRVTLVDEGITQDMFVESIEHRIRPGLRHDVTLLLSPSLPYGNVIVLGVGPGLGTGVLGR